MFQTCFVWLILSSPPFGCSWQLLERVLSALLERPVRVPGDKIRFLWYFNGHCAPVRVQRGAVSFLALLFVASGSCWRRFCVVFWRVRSECRATKFGFFRSSLVTARQLGFQRGAVSFFHSSRRRSGWFPLHFFSIFYIPPRLLFRARL